MPTEVGGHRRTENAAIRRDGTGTGSGRGSHTSRCVMQFVLYPMIHMAKPAFYAAVTARLKRADVVVVEDVGGGRGRSSVLVGALTLSYRVLRFNQRAKLVEQEIDYAALGVPVVRPSASMTGCVRLSAVPCATGCRKAPPCVTTRGPGVAHGRQTPRTSCRI